MRAGSAILCPGVGLRPVWNDDGHLVCWEPSRRLELHVAADRSTESAAAQRYAGIEPADTDPGPGAGCEP
jgi:hypothetical protein